MIEFDYRRQQLPSGDLIYRPVAKVYLPRPGNEWIAEYFYVDSGSDYTLVPYRMGRFLGLDTRASDLREMCGIGGRIGVRFTVIPMRIGDYQFDCTIAWAQVETVPLLLGRTDVFDHFDVTFQQRRKKTVFARWRRRI
jgi:hypothetical protein